MDEALKVDLWTLPEWGRRLVAEGGSAAEWAVYRAHRERVLEAAELWETADVACSCC